jgi:CRISPR system Cascade subunit CasE
MSRKKARIGLRKESDQLAWLERKFGEAGARLLGCNISTRGLQYSRKNPAVDQNYQTHQAVLYEGYLLVKHPDRLEAALADGIGPAKGFGFGLLSLAPA